MPDRNGRENRSLHRMYLGDTMDRMWGLTKRGTKTERGAHRAASRFYSRFQQNSFVWLAARPHLAFDWIRMWKSLPVLSWIRAANAFVEGDFTVASSFYEQGLSRNLRHPARHCARLDYAYCLFRLGRIVDASEELESLISEGAMLKNAYLLLARLQHVQGASLSALSTICEYLENFPEDVQALAAYIHISGQCRIRLPKLTQVKGELQALKSKFLLDDHRQLIIDAALAHYEVRFGDRAVGERLLARVLATGQAPTEAVLLRGEAFLEVGRIEQARQQLERAFRMSPQNPIAPRLLAETYLVPGDFSEPTWAVQLSELSCQLSAWKNARCLEVLSRAYEASGEDIGAELVDARLTTSLTADGHSFKSMESGKQGRTPSSGRHRAVRTAS